MKDSQNQQNRDNQPQYEGCPLLDAHAWCVLLEAMHKVERKLDQFLYINAHTTREKH